MALPRRILAGKTYLITRRVVQRQFLLRPSKTLNEIVFYCLSYAADKFGIEVHAFCFLSNHYHMVLTDRHRRLPKFMQWLNLYLAKCINVMYGRWESVWAPGSFSMVTLVSPEDVVDKIVYTLTNPVAAGLVRSGDQWPGARTRAQDVGNREYVTERPGFFFTEAMSEKVRLRLVRPPGFSEMGEEEFAQLVRERVGAKETEIQRECETRSAGFLGRKRVLKQSPFGSPQSREPRRQMNPRIASKDKWRRIEALQRLGEFLEQYHIALRKFCAGVRDVVFPEGTYWMRCHYRVRCAGPP